MREEQTTRESEKSEHPLERLEAKSSIRMPDFEVCNFERRAQVCKVEGKVGKRRCEKARGGESGAQAMRARAIGDWRAAAGGQLRTPEFSADLHFVACRFIRRSVRIASSRLRSTTGAAGEAAGGGV